MTSGMRLGTCFVLGVVVSVVAVAMGAQDLAALVGWDAAAALFVSWLGIVVTRSGPGRTRELASAEDSSAPVADVVLLLAAVASLAGVGLLLVQGAQPGGLSPSTAIAVSLITLFASWAVVHLVFTTRYARLFFTGEPGGIDFNQEDPPRYTDFAYLAFTIGMTFQVSDTDLTDQQIRATALRHALLSYLFGALILATTINLVAGLAK